MAIATNPKQTFTYVLKADRKLPVAEQTTWDLKPLTIDEQTEISDSMLTTTGVKGEMSWKGGTTELIILRRGLRGVHNFRDESAVTVPFQMEDKTVTNDFLDRVLPADRRELANAITEGGHVTKVEGD